MLRKTLRRLDTASPHSFSDINRYSNVTFASGVHRESPLQTKVYDSPTRPLERLKHFWFTPTARGTLLASWTFTGVIALYCFAMEQENRATYMLNTVLLRNLHQETLRADASEQRLKQLEGVVELQARNEVQLKQTLDTEVTQISEINKDLKRGIVNYELERNRERARAKIIHERNQQLVKEMADLRAESSSLKKENEVLRKALQVREAKSK